MIPTMQDIEVAHLRAISELIYKKYNYDFRNYATSSFRRRVARILEVKKLTPANLLTRLAEAPWFVHEFVGELTVNVTEMFRDPQFWRAMRDEIIPALPRKKRLRIWHAGCSSGEEVITMCIALHEAGVLEEVTITATDLDEKSLERAKNAAYPLKKMGQHEENYRAFGGLVSRLEGNYYSLQNGRAVFHPELLRRVSFLRHDLVTGVLLGPFDLILCRNVMIYFNETLQKEVLRKFHESLHLNGFLAIGSKESLIWSDCGNDFVSASREEKIYRKIK